MGIENYNHRDGSRLAIFQAVFALLTIVCGSIQAGLSPHELNPFATGWWLGWSFPLSLLHVPAIATGFAAARSRSRCAITANMVVNILVVVLVSTVQVITYLIFTVTVATLDDVDQLMQISENNVESNAVNIASNTNAGSDMSGIGPFQSSVAESVSNSEDSSQSFSLSALFFGHHTKVYLALCIAMMILGIAQMIVTIWSSAIGCNVICCGSSGSSPAYVPLQNPGVVVTVQQPVEVAQPVNAQMMQQHAYAPPQYHPAQVAFDANRLPPVETQHGVKV